jgi:Holliday junction DNA helicase RuvB
VFFLDEIHRMSRPAEEMLYLAMEDFRVDVIVGKGPGATEIPLEIPRFTLVGATTRAGLLPGPLRDRFGFTGQLDYYDAADLVAIVQRSADPARRRPRRRLGARHRRPQPRHPPHRQPAAAPRPRLRPGQGVRADHPPGGGGGTRTV